MIVLDKRFRQGKIPTFCIARNEVGKWLSEKYSLGIVHLEKIFCFVKTSKQCPKGFVASVRF